MFKKKKQPGPWGSPKQMEYGQYEMDESMSYHMQEEMPYHMEGPGSYHMGGPNPHHMGEANPHYMGYMPYHMEQSMHHHHEQSHHLKHETLMNVGKWVDYGMKEAKKTSYKHAMTEVAAISYLLGKGMPPKMAYKMVESWETNEKFY